MENAFNALLATFNCSVWSVARTSKKITLDVNRDLAESGGNIGRYVRNLINTGAPEYRAVCKARDLARSVHYAYTLPWQEGLRLLNPLAADDYREQMQNAQEIFEQTVGSLVAAYPRLKAEAKSALNQASADKYFRESDYPDVQDLAELFGMTVTIVPLPHDSQFDAMSEIIGSELAQTLANDLQAQHAKQWTEATKSVWDRLYKALSHASNQLHNGERIHDSVMSNLQELTDLLPILNVGKDPELEQRRQELQSLFRAFSPATVKDKGNRKSCAEEVDSILSKINF